MVVHNTFNSFINFEVLRKIFQKIEHLRAFRNLGGLGGSFNYS